MNNLGGMYNNGWGVSRDASQAAQWLLKALRAGNEFTLNQMTTNSRVWSIKTRKELQRLLRSEGLYSGAIDGKFGPSTKAAFARALKELDQADRRAASYAEYSALEQGQPGAATPWRNPGSGHYGMVVPGRPYKLGAQYCRDYTHTIYIEGRPQTMRGTACRNSDGTWRKAA